MDHNYLRRYIQSFSLDDCALGSQGYNRVLLQLFGYAGHGKSSFINSCKFALDGQYEMIAEAGETTDGGAYTMERRSYKLTDTITIVDNRGFGTMDKFEAIEIYGQLGNFLPLDEKVEWRKDFGSVMGRIEDAGIDPNHTDFIVPIFIYSVCKTMSDREESEVKTFLRTVRNMTGIFPIVVLTYKTSENYFKVEKKFKCLGAEGVFALENYTEKDHLQTRGRHTDILNILKSALDDVKFYMEHKKDPVRERVERKKFLLKMCHSNVMTTKKQTEETKKPEKP
ncbi:uncharacterized protein RCH25_037994 [Pelodytes ibericus]